MIVTIDDKEQINELVKYAIHTYPDLHVIARAVDRNHTYDLWAYGCRDIIRESYDSSLRIGRSAFEALGASKAAAEALKDEFNALDRRAMIEVAGAYDVSIPAHENDAYIAKVREVIAEWEPGLRERMAEILTSESYLERD